MKKLVWVNRSNKQLCVTIPRGSNIKEGDTVEVTKSRIKRIAYSGVVGDLFHYGHLQSLQFANSISDYNIVGVFTDNVVAKYRIRPIANLRERKAIYSALNCVDRVVVQHSRDPTENLKKIHEEFPDAEIILVHGSDLKYVHGSEYVKKIGGKVVQHPYYDRLSTFKIINKIIENKGKFKDIINFTSIIQGMDGADYEYEKGNKTIVSTKASTLQAIKPLLKKSKIEEMIVFTVSDWKNKKKHILNFIKNKFLSSKIVVRSSSINEDRTDKSLAGCFESVLNVDSTDLEDIETSINNVINSYKTKESESSFNQILIQQQTTDIIISGVIFTRVPETNAPYYVINYDDSSGKTDTVTKGIENKAIKISRFVKIDDAPREIRGLLISINEIESIIPKIGLDIEFAVNKKEEVIIFQVRPLTAIPNKETNDTEVKKCMQFLQKHFQNLSGKKDHLAGERTIFADMPDWNPAEIIGHNPNHLDYSLYDYIITDSAWHEARTSQGYYNVNPAKLVVLFGNKPYINVRSSFNSFTPSSLSNNLREKLVSFYINKLEKNPELQDKVEFEVAYTCYDLSFKQRSKELLEAGFTEEEVDELKESLIALTNNLIIGSKKSISENLSFLKEMEKNREKIVSEIKSENIPVTTLLKNAKFLLDDCRKKGTVQFSKLARLGFIGKILLKSLVANTIINNEIYDGFMNSIRTVATEISEDFKLMGNNQMSTENFIKKYYHLRPGSYDITSLRYDSIPNLLNTPPSEIKEPDTIYKKKDTGSFVLDKKTEEKITAALKQEGLNFNAKELFEFTRASLEAREYSKFEFTKNLSEAIELIAVAGKKMGFTRQELAMLDINDLFLNRMDREELTKAWKEKITTKFNERNIYKKIELPPIIFNERDFYIVRYYTPRPNYITQKKVEGKLVKIGDMKSTDVPNIEGKIVMLENGDPGYDWIFTRNPAGLVTKYGGVASHMSIRCAEFGLPAAIGSGILFDHLINAECVVLDCGAKSLTPIKG